MNSNYKISHRALENFIPGGSRAWTSLVTQLDGIEAKDIRGSQTVRIGHVQFDREEIFGFADKFADGNEAQILRAWLARGERMFPAEAALSSFFLEVFENVPEVKPALPALTLPTPAVRLPASVPVADITPVLRPTAERLAGTAPSTADGDTANLTFADLGMATEFLSETNKRQIEAIRGTYFPPAVELPAPRTTTDEVFADGAMRVRLERQETFDVSAPKVSTDGTYQVTVQGNATNTAITINAPAGSRVYVGYVSDFGNALRLIKETRKEDVFEVPASGELRIPFVKADIRGPVSIVAMADQPGAAAPTVLSKCLIHLPGKAQESQRVSVPATVA